MKDLPCLIVATTVAVYWSCVLGLSALRRLRDGRAVGLLPRQGSERLLWPFLVAAVVAWNVLPWLALRSGRVPWRLPEVARASDLILALRGVAAGGAVVAFLLTLSCWWQMGRSWGMAVVPGQASALVRGGAFAWVRHPIYGLSLALMACTVAVLPTLPMALAGLTHATLLVLKARSEEAFLLSVHGQEYEEYRRTTGRFFPRVLA